MTNMSTDHALELLSGVCDIMTDYTQYTESQVQKMRHAIDTLERMPSKSIQNKNL